MGAGDGGGAMSAPSPSSEIAEEQVTLIRVVWQIVKLPLSFGLERFSKRLTSS
jgi:hypothetical protein